MLVSITGMVGAGKTSLARALGIHLGGQVQEESVADNPWLSKFYEASGNLSPYMLPLQLHFMNTLAAGRRDAYAAGGTWVFDQSFYFSFEVFVRGAFRDGLLGHDEFRLLESTYQLLRDLPGCSDEASVIYLSAPFELALERIYRRGRPSEVSTPRSYWEKVYARYEEAAERYRGRLIRLEVQSYDLSGEARCRNEFLSSTGASLCLDRESCCSIRRSLESST